MTALNDPWSMIIPENIANAVLITSVYLFYRKKHYLLWLWFLVVGLISQAYVTYMELPVSLDEALVLIVLVPPSAIMGFYVARQSKNT
jgi:hypothetical protein